jgi:hypothetical protein
VIPLLESISQSSLVLPPQHRSFLLCEISTKTPITGRTHQLRVHCAAMGHPILGDPAYGFCGEAHPNGGFSDDTMSTLPSCASFELRRAVEDAVRENGRTMCLHARQLTVQHPITNEEVSFEASPSFWGDAKIKLSHSDELRFVTCIDVSIDYLLSHTAIFNAIDSSRRRGTICQESCLKWRIEWEYILY